MKHCGPTFAVISGLLLLAMQLPVAHSNSPPLGQMNKRQSEGGGFENEPNGTEFVWTIQDVYEGQKFFE